MKISKEREDNFQRYGKYKKKLKKRNQYFSSKFKDIIMGVFSRLILIQYYFLDNGQYQLYN